MKSMILNGYMRMKKYKQTEAGTVGVLAQQGERRVCNADVGGSIPSHSTSK